MARLSRASSEVLDRYDQALDDNKLFIRDMTRRTEKVVQDLVRGNEAFKQERAGWIDAVIARLDDLKSESEAQRRAIFTLLDRLPPFP